MNPEVLGILLAASIAMAVPVLLAALGGLVAERSGVFSIGLEGYMLAGAFGATVGSHFTGSAWSGLFCAAIAGMAFAAVHAVLSIHGRANQIVSGVTINIVALGLTGFFNRALFGLTHTAEIVAGFHPIAIPFLSDIPLLGPSLFQESLFTYIAALLTIAVAVYLVRTHSGLALRAVGENPDAADARGIAVVRTRYAAVLFSGAAAGLGGAALSIGQVYTFTEGMTAGRGFIALAAVIFSGWRTGGTVGACLIFGAADAAQVWMNALGVHVPFQALNAVPYLTTLVALSLMRGRKAMPAALGVPFVRG